MALVSSKRAQAFLSLVFVIGGIVAVIGVLLAFLANTFIDTGYGYQASATAEAVATSGAEDALLQLDRNASFSSSGYSLAVGSSTATVVVTNNAAATGAVTVLSTASVSNRTRKVQVVLSETTSTGQLTITSWQEIQ